MHDTCDEADRIFESYQRAAIETTEPLFERRALTQHTSQLLIRLLLVWLTATVKGQMLAQFFAVNSGATYKYAVQSQSLTFDASPTCVTDALKL